MKHTLQQVFHSGKFIVGFCIFVALLLFVIIYPLIIKDLPLVTISQGNFAPPGVYVSTYDSIGANQYTLELSDAASKRLESKLNNDDRLAMKDWLVMDGVPADQIDTTNTINFLTNVNYS